MAFKTAELKTTSLDIPFREPSELSGSGPADRADAPQRGRDPFYFLLIFREPTGRTRSQGCRGGTGPFADQISPIKFTSAEAARNLIQHTIMRDIHHMSAASQAAQPADSIPLLGGD
jgi:hypothetical protein